VCVSTVECFRPVSAYALFFRDTQAAIKCQNPSASFGEMSKIVAAMWDTLDDMHKNVSIKARLQASAVDFSVHLYLLATRFYFSSVLVLPFCEVDNLAKWL